MELTGMGCNTADDPGGVSYSAKAGYPLFLFSSFSL